MAKTFQEFVASLGTHEDPPPRRSVANPRCGAERIADRFFGEPSQSGSRKALCTFAGSYGKTVTMSRADFEAAVERELRGMEFRTKEAGRG